MVVALWAQVQDPEAWVEANGLKQLNDETALRAYVQQAIAAHPEMLAGYRAGKLTLSKALMGAAMSLSGGKANPAKLQQLMDEALKEA